MSTPTKDKPATFYEGRPGNSFGEAPIDPHWSQMLRCSDGRFVHGYGATKEVAEADASLQHQLAEEEIAMPPKEQIKAILARCSGDKIYDADIQRLLKLMGRVLTE
jgi:hypothetical protein